MSKGEESFQKLSPVQHGILGLLAGTIEVTILQPILYCKNASQQKLGLTLNPRILYRGLVMSVTNMAILTGLQFPLTNAVVKVLTGGTVRPLSDHEQVLAGFLGGAISGFACGPMELVMIQQQRFGGSLLSTPSRIINTSGASGMFRGVVNACGREGLFTAGYLGLGPVFASKLQDQMGQAKAKILGAICAGLIAGTLSHPMDTIKTCMQGDIERTKYSTLTKTASTLYAEEGIGRFFRGWGWRTGRMSAGIWILNQCMSNLPPLIFPNQ